jgi:hypothetical protein
MRINYLNSLLLEEGDNIERLVRLKRCSLSEAEIILLNQLIKERNKKYDRISYEINKLKYGRKNKITDEMIQNARDYDIYDLIGSSLKKNIKCPFHDDNHPSASIRNNRLHCFACNRTWDSIDFVMEKENLTFTEAIERLQ